MKNPTCSECNRTATSRCGGCGAYFCGKHWRKHARKIALEIRRADDLTDYGRHAPKERNR
jgi:hypothetical protein